MRRAVVLAALEALCACAAERVSLDQLGQPEIVLQTLPPGCTVDVDGVERGTTPFILRAADREASHAVTLLREGYLPTQLTIRGEDMRAQSGRELMTILRPAGWSAGLAFDPASAADLTRAGEVLARAGRCREAIGYFQQALQLDMHQARTHRSLGSCYARLGRAREALDEYKAYLLRAPDAPDAARLREQLSRAGGDIDVAPARKEEN